VVLAGIGREPSWGVFREELGQRLRYGKQGAYAKGPSGIRFVGPSPHVRHR
jgi:hypothetical protein